MDPTWAFQLLLAVGSLVIDRQLELDPEREADGIFAHQFGRNRRAEEVRNVGESGAEAADAIRRARMVAVPPGGPVTLGFIYLIPVSMFIPFIRRRTIDLGRENELDTDDYYDGDEDMTADEAGSDGPEVDLVVDGATSALRDAQNEFEEIPTGTANSTSAPVPVMSSPPPLSTSARELDHVPRVQSGKSGRFESSRGSSVDIDYATSGDAAASARRTPDPFPSPSPSPSAADDRSSAAYAELFDELHREQLALIDLYFHFLQVETDECKLRMICEMAASPEKFYPLSDIFLHETKPKIRAPRTPVRSRFRRFHEAARRGFNGGTCATPSSDVAVAGRRERRGSRPNKDERRLCRRSAEDVVQMERLWILRELGRRVNLEFAPFT